jgi:hypothetical protein
MALFGLFKIGVPNIVLFGTLSNVAPLATSLRPDGYVTFVTAVTDRGLCPWGLWLPIRYHDPQ